MAERPAHGGYPGEPKAHDEGKQGDTFLHTLGLDLKAMVPEGCRVAVGQNGEYLALIIHPAVPKDVILVLTDDDGMPLQITIQPNEE